jgi:hypothetical protein
MNLLFYSSGDQIFHRAKIKVLVRLNSFEGSGEMYYIF